MTAEDKGTVSRRSLKSERALLSSSAIRALAQERWNKSRPWLDWPMLVLFIALVTAVFAPFGSSTLPVPRLDSIATSTLRAERNLVVEDKETTILRRQQAAAAVPPQFNYDPELHFTRRDQVVAAVDRLVERREADELDIAARRAAFEADLGQPLNAKVFELLESVPDPHDASAAMTFFLNMVLDRMIVADRALLPEQSPIALRRAAAEHPETLFHLGGILDVSQAWRLLRARTNEAPYGEARILRTWILETALALVQPNLVPNGRVTAETKAAAVAAIEPVLVRIGRGEVVIREGDRVTAQAQARIRALNEASTGRLGWVDSVAFAALLAGLVGLGAFFFRRAHRPLQFSRKEGYITLVSVALAGLACIAALYAGRGIAEGFGIDPRAAAFLCPVALSAALVGILVNARTSLMVGVALSLLVAYRADGDIWLATYYLVGVLVAGMSARRCRHRSDLLKVGLVVALSQAAAAPAALTLGGAAAGPDYFIMVAFALASGGLVAVSAMGLLPVFEYVFDEVTDVRLMELGSGDHPLLKKLALRSPGTYHHSVMIANLAEAAADGIGANSLQCRVMALYHDIGKSVRPVYFAENQRQGNIHDGLPPELSARIIFAHVTDGIELARKHRLGRAVIEAVTQHQGTTKLAVFYQKAVERAAQAGLTVDEDEYRYPGPRPTTRESSIIMLGDSVEAATRALKDPSPAEVQARVGKVIGEKIADGQLSDSELTLGELEAIEKAFTRVLVLGVYHSRIEYPAVGPAQERQRGADEEAKVDNARTGDRGRDTQSDVARRFS